MLYQRTGDTEEDKEQKTAFDYWIYLSAQDLKLEIRKFVSEKQNLVLGYTTYIYFTMMPAFLRYIEKVIT